MIVDLPYQRIGAKFLAERRHAYLADEMRLGKSRQSIMAADMCGHDRVLIVCPAIARVNWVREFEKHAIYTRKFQIITNRTAFIEKGKSCVVSYELARDLESNAVLRAQKFDLLIVDEAHYLKARTSKQTAAILGPFGLARSVKATWLLSGTPTPNGDPGELWPVLRTLAPEVITQGDRVLEYEPFMDRYTVRRQTHRGRHAITKVVKLAHQDELNTALDSFMLRRTKKQVRPELPKMLFGEISVEVSESDYAEIALTDLPESETPELSTLRRQLGELKVKPLAEFIRTELANGLDKLVVFAWHVNVIERLAELIKHHSEATKIGVVTVYGNRTAKQNQASIDQFRTNPDRRVLVGQIKACGTAVSMAAADNVIFAELSWVPGDNEQALMRIEDPSKNYACMTRFAIARGTLDDALMGALRRKGNWTKEILGA